MKTKTPKAAANAGRQQRVDTAVLQFVELMTSYECGRLAAAAAAQRELEILGILVELRPEPRGEALSAPAVHS